MKSIRTDPSNHGAEGDERIRLVRSGKGGATIHLNGCPRATGKTWPWIWAEGRDDSEWYVKAWLKPCKSCLPEQRAAQDALRNQSGQTVGGMG